MSFSRPHKLLPIKRFRAISPMDKGAQSTPQGDLLDCRQSGPGPRTRRGVNRRSGATRPDRVGADGCAPACGPWASKVPRQSSTGSASLPTSDGRAARPTSRRPASGRSARTRERPRGARSGCVAAASFWCNCRVAVCWITSSRSMALCVIAMLSSAIAPPDKQKWTLQP